MNYYPVAIPTLCRFEHFKRCVESLAKNTHAANTELIIGLDYPTKEEHWDGYNKINSYIPNISGFKKITLFRREYNYGAEANSIDLANYAFSKYDAYIYTEDDNEFSPCFLDFMNKALEKYKYEEKISSVSGYCAIAYENIAKKGIIYTHDNNAWGFGLWKHKENIKENLLICEKIWNSTVIFWKTFFKAPAITIMFATMMLQKEQWGDVIRSINNIHNKTFQVRPYVSLVRNRGCDGSGLHCENIDSLMSEQYISVEKKFQLADNNEIKNSLHFSTEFYFLLPHNKLKALYSIFRAGMFIIKKRLTHA